MNEYLEQAILNAINSQTNERPIENESQWIADEDERFYYMQGYVNGIHTRWTVNKPVRIDL